VSTKKPSEFRKLLFDEPPRTDLVPVIGNRLQNVGVHSALAEPTAHFISDLYTEGLNMIRLIAAAAKSPEKATPELASQLRQSAAYLEHKSGEAVSFLDRVSAFLDRKVEEDADDTEAFEKNVARLEKLGRLEDSSLMGRLSTQAEAAATHGSWALSNIYLSLVKLVGIVELLRFEHVQPTTVENSMAEIHLDMTHRLRPALTGSDVGRVGLLELLGTPAPSS
jgi:hypothetical protein